MKQSEIKQFLVWDIDGTLMDGSGAVAGAGAFLAAAKTTFGVSFDKMPFGIHGTTDQFIGERMAFHSMDPGLVLDCAMDPSPESVQRFFDNYEKALPGEMKKQGNPSLLPGVPEALAFMSRQPQVRQGLLTGNLREGAKIKLERVGIWNYFEGSESFGIFGNLAAERRKLGPIALEKIREQYGQEVRPSQLVIIGDTPGDIAVAHHIGAHVIAVATGTFKEEQLRSCNPSILMANLGNLDQFRQVLEDLKITRPPVDKEELAGQCATGDRPNSLLEILDSYGSASTRGTWRDRCL